jgi:HD-GYP domain-containing protein (c-di-GMP phosphodiesterase class II)
VVVDLKGRYLLDHSGHVAALADRAAGLAGHAAPERSALRAAALLHDLGRAGVPSSVWDRPGPLGAADWERVRLHAYWTGRVLQRCPGWRRWPRRRRPTTSGWTAAATTAERGPAS